MRLPQRTPWASLQEVDELCSWVYADPTDVRARSCAVQRLSAWRAITALPHALDSLLSLLVVVLQDDEAARRPVSALVLRQSYATAIIRLVNGLVDPLQAGVYARSIASIASQLGLPSWLVELRHAATHEDLPSLELLREAARESLDWLLQHYFLPLLNPSSTSARAPPSTRPLGPLLAQYKHVSKIVSRDASLASRHQPDVDRIMRDIERWLGEAAVAAGSADEDEREAYALDRLSEEFLRVGMLVPLSRKKRAVSKGQVLPPSPLLAIWTPLLTNVRALHPTFPSAILARIIARLLYSSSDEDDNGAQAADEHERVTYDYCLASWGMWLAASDPPLREEAFVLLAKGLGPRSHEEDKNLRAARALLAALNASDARLASASQAMMLTATQVPATDEPWDDAHMTVMHDRLQTVLAASAGPRERGEKSVEPDKALEERGESGLPTGWRLVGSGWKPCPIGVYVPA